MYYVANCCSTGVMSLPVWMSSGDDTEAILGASNLKRLFPLDPIRDYILVHLTTYNFTSQISVTEEHRLVT